MGDRSQETAALEAAVAELVAALDAADDERVKAAHEALLAAVFPIAHRHQRKAWRPDGRDDGDRATRVLVRWWQPKAGPTGPSDLVNAHRNGERGKALSVIAVRKIRDAVVDLRREWDREHRPLLGYLEYKLKAVVQAEHDKGPGERRLKLDPPPPPGTRNANRWVLLERWTADPARRRLAVRAEPPLSRRADGSPDATGCSLPATPTPKPKKGFRLHSGGPAEVVGWVECSLDCLDGTMRPAGLALRLFNLYDAGAAASIRPPGGPAPGRRTA